MQTFQLIFIYLDDVISNDGINKLEAIKSIGQAKMALNNKKAFISKSILCKV